MDHKKLATNVYTACLTNIVENTIFKGSKYVRENRTNELKAIKRPFGVAKIDFEGVL